MVAGGATQAAAATANHVAQQQTSGAANAAGATSVTVYVGATAVTANQYDDGYLLVHRTTSGTAGMMYPPLAEPAAQGLPGPLHHAELAAALAPVVAQLLQ